MRGPQRQFQETAAMLLVGDGVLGLLRPSAHCEVWRVGNQAWDSVLEWFSRRPMLVRSCAAIEMAAGLLLAERQFGNMPPSDMAGEPVIPERSV